MRRLAACCVTRNVVESHIQPAAILLQPDRQLAAHTSHRIGAFLSAGPSLCERCPNAATRQHGHRAAVAWQPRVEATAVRSRHHVQHRRRRQAQTPGRRRLQRGAPRTSLEPCRCSFSKHCNGTTQCSAKWRALRSLIQVYQGRHLHRDVAVKVLPLDGDSAHAAQREVRRRLLLTSGFITMHGHHGHNYNC